MKKEFIQTQKQGKKSTSARWWQKAGALFFVVVITIIAFLPSLNNGFTNWDDDVYVINNPYIVNLSADNLKNIFTQPVSNNYNPLTILSFALEKKWLGTQPEIHHFNNLLLHLICTILAFWLALLLGLRWFGALIVALLFGIHPMRVESVAWITERKDVLFGLFYLAALISYIFYIKKEKNNYKFLLLTLLLFILSLLSKIQAVVLPLSLLLLDEYFGRSEGWLKRFIEKIPFFALSLLIGGLGLYFLDNTLDLRESFAFGERLLLGCYAIGVYLFKLFAPFPLAVYYPYPEKISNSLPVIYYAAPILILLLAYLVFHSLKHTKVVLFGSLFFLVNVIFVLQILQAGEAFLADRFTYIAYWGLFFVIAYFCEYLYYKKPIYKYFSISIITIYTLFFTYFTHQQCKIWNNSETLWTQVITQYPEQVPVAYNNRGNFYREKGQLTKALTDYNKAITLNPSYYLAYTNRGNIHYDSQKYDEAYKDYHKTLSLHANNPKALNNLAAIYFQKKNYAKTIEYAGKAINLDKNYADAYMNRGVSHSVNKDFPLAKKDYDQFLRLQPNHSQVLHWRGIANRNIGKLQAAVKDFEQSISLRSDYSAAYLELSYTYNELKNWNLALKNAQKAQQLGEKVAAHYLAFLRTEKELKGENN